MTKQIIIPFGPQHPVLPEPIHIDLVLEDERVVEAIPSIGYIHRGFEKLVEKREFTEYGACPFPQDNLVRVFKAPLPPPVAGLLCRLIRV